MHIVRGALAALVVTGLGMSPAAADEVKARVSASMMLNILSAPSPARESAYDRSITDPGPAPRSDDGVVQPDGSVRYGSESRGVTVNIKNPCPPGTAHYEPPPLPGRRVRTN
ncbi:MAG TPA: hypothetical protein VID04_13445 [Methylomirabilota bacterium]|jgi:hypothetical protein